MEFNKAYNRQEFMNFLQNSFLPNDFVPTEEQVVFSTQTKHSTEAVKLGSSETLDLVVYEIKHTSKHDARVALSKEAFRMLADEMEDRALVIFVPEDNCDNYRFSFIEVTLDIANDGKKVTYNYSNPRRYSYLLGKDIAYYTPNKYLNAKGRVVNDEDLHSRFSVEVLTKEFYNELSNWYAWAIKEIRFPNDIKDENDDDKYNNEGAIRLITRLIFVWFLKQRHLIPNEFFDEQYIASNLIKDFEPHKTEGFFNHKSLESKYYKAILQNLFFAMLNSPITAEGSTELSERHFRNNRGDYDNNKLMRYEDYFTNPQLFVDLANNIVPFLNGGLFDCLDDKDNGMYYDGFSDRELVKKSLVVPDFLFFGDGTNRTVDLSEWYGDKKKKRVPACGIIDILKRYNFTVEENTPFDKEVSLDPELLGKVFENLLASFNPETQTTARKQTGSFYTPREIVQYMVDESLIAHLKRTVGEELEPKLRQLLQYTDDTIDLTEEQCKSIMISLYNCKILDPACGSGAFPMGILQQMVHILGRIDPENRQWKDMMMSLAIDETTEAFKNASSEERSDQIKDIERSFDEGVNRPDYARKLYLIENCIYGVDIQPIAIQISKLRFFISLIVDQKTNSTPADNFGVRPLPNLEAKFVAANTLIGLESELSLADNAEVIINLKKQLRTANHKIFSAKTVKTKRKYKQQVVELRQAIATNLHEMGFIDNSETEQLASWDMFDQNASSLFFDSEWMFGVKGGFDIVIGNPPYVKIEYISQEERKVYQERFIFFVKRADLFSVFIEHALKTLSSQQGITTFIIPSVIHSNLSYQKLRNYFLDKHWLAEACYTGGNVFEGPTVDTTILRFEKSSVNDVLIKKTFDISNQQATIVNASSFNAQGNIISISSNSSNSVIDKLFDQSFKSLDSQARVFQGIVTGNNPVYIFDTEEQAIKNGIDKALLYPLCHGRDIGKYEVRSLERRVLYLDNSVDIDDYPQTKQWLIQYKDVLSNRREAKKGTIRWYSLQWPRVKSELDFKEKILIQNTRNESLKTRIVATIDNTSVYASQGINFVIPKTEFVSIHYILGILNSKLVNFLFATKFLNLAIKADYIKQIRIPQTRDYRIDDLVNKIFIAKRNTHEVDITEYEQEVDRIVYKLYGLTYEEVKIVDPDTPITKEEYEGD